MSLADKQATLENKQIYTSEMAKGIEEKLFLGPLPSDTLLVDFGCADGQLSEAIKQTYSFDVIGYDIQEDLLPSRGQYYSDWSDVMNEARGQDGPVAIYFSSIFHELYSFGQEDGAIMKTMQLSPDFICIRDMYVTDSDKRVPIENDRVNEIIDNVNLRLVNSFSCNHGPVMSKGNMLHFLMKHRFAYNWDYEILEDYLALRDQDIAFWTSLGKTVFRDHSPLPYYQDVFETRYGYELTTPTHIKLIIDRR